MLEKKLPMRYLYYLFHLKNNLNVCYQVKYQKRPTNKFYQNL